MIKDINRSISKAMANMKSSFLGKITSIMPKENKINAKAGADNEARDIVIITPYGFYSLPDKDLDAQVIFNNNARRATVVGVDNFPIKPMDLEINEVVIFNKNSQAYIHLKNDGMIDIKAPAGLNIDGNVNVKGTINSTAGG
jgi:hypothetical protein